MLGILKPFAAAFGWIKKIFTKAMSEAEKLAPLAVDITARLKKIVESDFVAGLAAITPTDVDDKLLAILKKVIPEVAMKTAIIEKILSQTDTDTDAVAAIVEYLKSLEPEARVKYWVSFAGDLNIALADGKIEIAEAIFLTQKFFIEKYLRQD